MRSQPLLVSPSGKTAERARLTLLMSVLVVCCLVAATLVNRIQRLHHQGYAGHSAKSCSSSECVSIGSPFLDFLCSEAIRPCLGPVFATPFSLWYHHAQPSPLPWFYSCEFQSSVWVLFCPTFLSVKNICVFLSCITCLQLTQKTKIDWNRLKMTQAD